MSAVDRNGFGKELIGNRDSKMIEGCRENVVQMEPGALLQNLPAAFAAAVKCAWHSHSFER